MSPHERGFPLGRPGIGDSLDYLGTVWLEWWRRPIVRGHRDLEMPSTLLDRRPEPDIRRPNCTGVAARAGARGPGKDPTVNVLRTKRPKPSPSMDATRTMR